MTATILCLGFLLPIGSIGLDMIRDQAADQAALDIARIRSAFLDAEPRDRLLPEDWAQTWPERQTPSDLPARLGLIVAEDHGRHHVGVAIGTAAQRRLWDSPTGQFWLIVEQLGDLSEPCSHCATPEDGEPSHAGCPGCACPCTLIAMEEALP